MSNRKARFAILGLYEQSFLCINVNMTPDEDLFPLQFDFGFLNVVQDPKLRLRVSIAIGFLFLFGWSLIIF